MKYLKLDARHPECHGLAKALVGSKTKEGDLFVAVVTHQQFCDSFSFYAIDRITDGEDGHIHAEMKHECGWGEAVAYSEVLLPLDILKLCPFVAMREEIMLKSKESHKELFAVWGVGPSSYHAKDVYNFGQITRIEGYYFDITVSGGKNLQIGGKYTQEEFFENFTLDLDNLPKGAEVVEL